MSGSDDEAFSFLGGGGGGDDGGLLSGAINIFGDALSSAGDAVNDAASAASGGGTALPDWITNSSSLRTLAGLSATSAGVLVTFAQDPGGFIRGVIFSELVGGILNLAAPFLEGILLLLVGSDVGFSMDEQRFGLADIIPWMLVQAALALASGIEAYGEMLLAVNRAIVPGDPSTPIWGVVYYGLLVVELVVTVRLLDEAVLDRALPAALALVNLDSVHVLIFGED